ncbi:MAG TPA: amidohydrolase family protein, partial [Candidatus Tyrphobacter sp.]
MLIRGGRVVDPAQGIDGLFDVRLGDVISQIGEHLEPQGDECIFDASGAFVAPGFIDMHVHLRDPGDPEKETIATGTAAAVRGGFTAVACMPNTRPALDSRERLGALAHAIAARAACRVYPIAAITRGRQGKEPLDYAALAAAGAVAFSDDGDPVLDGDLLRRAALLARIASGAFIEHALDERMREEGIIERDAHISAETGKTWHIAHVSTAVALDVIRAARERGTAITCEVTPHHLYFTEEIVMERGGLAKVYPPLRPRQDVDAIRGAVLRGEIDCFASDHAPHAQREKGLPYSEAAPGFTGLEIAIGAYALALPELSPSRFVAMGSTNPARVLGTPGGTLAVGTRADVSIFADRPW